MSKRILIVSSGWGYRGDERVAPAGMAQTRRDLDPSCRVDPPVTLPELLRA